MSTIQKSELEIKRRLAELEMIHNISQAASADLELDALLTLVEDNIRRVLDAQTLLGCLVPSLNLEN